MEREADRNDPSLKTDKSMALSNLLEDMPEGDVKLRVKLATQSYSKALYAFSHFDSVDIVRTFQQHGLVPERGDTDAEVSRWLMNPADFFRDPNVVPDAMGEGRWAQAAPMLEEMLAVYDSEMSPIVHAVAQRRLPAATWVPLLRWLVSEGCEGDFKPHFTAFASALANGRGPATLMLPKVQAQRAECVARLLLAAAKEYGRINVATLATEILISAGETATFRDQKALMHAVARSNRRGLDWQLRHSGRIHSALAEWRKVYLKTADGSLLVESARCLIDANDAGDGDEDKAPAADDEEEEAAQFTDFSRGVRSDRPEAMERAEGDEDEAAGGEANDDDDETNADGSVLQPAAAEPVEREPADVDSYFDNPPPEPEPEKKPAKVAAFFAKDERASDLSDVLSSILKDLPTTTRSLEQKKRKRALAAGEIVEEAADGEEVAEEPATRKRQTRQPKRRTRTPRAKTNSREWAEQMLKADADATANGKRTAKSSRSRKS